MVPSISNEERMAALEKAAAVREDRARMRRQLKDGEATLADVLADGSRAVLGARVSYVLESLPGVGRVRAAKAMEDCGISANRRVRGLGSRQRAALLDMFGGEE